jgi:hypothetical protein
MQYYKLFLLYAISDPSKASIDKFLRALPEQIQRQYIIAVASALKNKQMFTLLDH